LPLPFANMKTDKIRAEIQSFAGESRSIRFLLLAVALCVFGAICSPALITPALHYEIGDVAERDIKAPMDLLIEDLDATAGIRKEAIAAIRTVYDHDSALTETLIRQVRSAFGMIAKPAPENRAPEPIDWIVDRGIGLPDSASHSPIPQQQNITDLRRQDFTLRLGVSISPAAFVILSSHGVVAETAENIIQILKTVLDKGVVSNREVLLREAVTGIVLRDVATGEERVVERVEAFYGLDQARAVAARLARTTTSDSDYSLFSLVADLSQQLVQPNITLNRSETETRKRLAADSVKPVFYQIKAGEMLLREGERVTGTQLLKLRALQNQTRMEKEYVRVSGAVILILILMAAAYYLLKRHAGKTNLSSNKEILFLCSLFSVFLIMPRASCVMLAALISSIPSLASVQAFFYGAPMAAGAMTVSLFMGFPTALAFSIVLSTATTIIFHGKLEIFLYFLINSILGAYWMKGCRERRMFIWTGFRVGMLNAALVVSVTAYAGAFSWRSLVTDCSLGFFSGMISGVLTGGLVPLLEFLFHYTTDISLLELANLDRPILKQLLMEAPGTYHHSIVVGSMVEAAAAEINVNPLLAKVCGYYHDIGKIKKPMYFIENQIRGINRHDKLAPSMSSLILISHIKEGVEIARKHKLGPEIADAIRQHHGTSLIRYFFEKARRQKGEDVVKTEDFRYPGPKPQTREIGLVMLADVVEAASRTLDDPTPARIQGLVRDLINKIFSDGQLDHCDLTLQDIHKIAKSFIKILTGIHHHRIDYPERNGKERNGRINLISDRNRRPAVSNDRRNGAIPLRRIGAP